MTKSEIDISGCNVKLEFSNIDGTISGKGVSCPIFGQCAVDYFKKQGYRVALSTRTKCKKGIVPKSDGTALLS